MVCSLRRVAARPICPAGNTISFAADTLATAGLPAQKGINNSSDLLSIFLDMTNPTGLLTDLIGSLRVGMHVTGIGTRGGSESYVSNPITPGTFGVVPLPAALPLFGTALVGLATLRYRRRRKI